MAKVRINAKGLALVAIALAAATGVLGVSIAQGNGNAEVEPNVVPTLEGEAVARDRRFVPDYATFAPKGTWMLVHAAELIEPWELGDAANVSSAGRLLTTAGDAFEHADLVPVGITIADGLLWNRNEFPVRLFVSNEHGMIEIDLDPKQGVVFGTLENIAGIVAAPNDQRGCRCKCVDANGQTVRISTYLCNCNCANEIGGTCLDSNGNEVGTLQDCKTVVFPAIDLSE